jgi:hypothetical protein
MTEALRPFDRLREKPSEDLRNATHIRQVGEAVVLTAYDSFGVLIGESSLPMKPMFSDQDLIEADLIANSNL